MIFETFAQRQAALGKGSEPDVYVYDHLPEHFRRQINLILGHSLGPTAPGTREGGLHGNRAWNSIYDISVKEIESFASYNEAASKTIRFNRDKLIGSYLRQVSKVDDFISVLELACIWLARFAGRNADPRDTGATQAPKDALEEINARFEQHGIGYAFENGAFIRVDSRLLHAEIVKPALSLLTDAAFVKANAEFLTAHRHLRAGENKDAITAANRAFESMLKAICETEGWTYGDGDRASELITKVNTSGLFSHSFDKSFTAFVAMLKSGLPTIRNEAGGHGDGLLAAAVTPAIARLAINFTASNLLFLGETYAAMKRSKGGK